MDLARSPLQVTLSVWNALFLREALHRLFGARAAWLWLLLEPVAHIAVMLLIFAGASMHMVGGVRTAVWLMVGMVGYFMFSRVAMQGMNAVGANQALFAYRQVKPVDTVLVRCGLEAFLMLLITIVLFTGAGLMGVEFNLADPLAALEGLIGVWLFGVGFALITSVWVTLIPEFGKILGLLLTPLYFMSGVMFPLSSIPLPYRGWLMYNPLPHGIEAIRIGFEPYYNAVPETNIAYLYSVALLAILLGLALHDRYALRLATK